jgi:peptidoglycan L-alanyl-D-glutamate endopeptidase CwlK
MSLNPRSLANLEGVHPDLVRVVKLAAEKTDFLVTEGLRDIERQKQLKAAGKSRTLNSRHLTGHAVDLADCDGCYDIPDLDLISLAMKEAAKELNVTIEWGGDWPKFCDTPHFQLPWKQYPISGISATQKVVEAAKTKPSVAAVAATVVTVAQTVPLPALPPVPVEFTTSIINAESWQSFGGQAWKFVIFAQAQPVQAVFLSLALVAVWFWPRKA